MKRDFKKEVVNFLYKIDGYSCDEIAELLCIDCADVVDMLDFDE